MTFSFIIKKWNLKTPGRGSGIGNSVLYTREDYENKKRSDGSTELSKDDFISSLILKGLGGTDNVSDIDYCATRLRVTVVNSDLIDDDTLKKSGASGVIHKGGGVQVVYGPQVSVIKSNLEDYIAKVKEKGE